MNDVEGSNPEVANPGAVPLSKSDLRPDYDRLLAHFDKNPRRAAEKFTAFREKLIVIFDRRGFPDPAFEADDTFTRAACSDELEAVRDIEDFLYGVVRRQILEGGRRQHRQPVQLDESVHLRRIGVEAVTSGDSEERRFGEIKLQCLDSCLAKLRDRDRKLLLAYYQEQKTKKLKLRKLLADQLDIRIGTLRTRLTRLRAQVKVCCEACIKTSLEQVKHF